MLRRLTTLNPYGISDNELYQEWLKCKNDPVYFAATYCKVEHPIYGTSNFQLYPHQEDAIRDYVNHNMVLHLTSPETGKLPVLLAYVIWFAIFHPNKSIYLGNYNLPGSVVIRSNFNTMLFNLPDWILPKILLQNSREIMFDNYSSIIITATTPYSLRGTSFSLIVLYDFALMDSKSQKELWYSVVCSTIHKTQTIICTNAQKSHTWFDDAWQNTTNDPTVHHIEWSLGLVQADDLIAEKQKRSPFERYF